MLDFVVGEHRPMTFEPLLLLLPKEGLLRHTFASRVLLPLRFLKIVEQVKERSALPWP